MRSRANNYNMIIVPNGFDYSKYPKQWVGTGHFKMSSYTPNVGATFVPTRTTGDACYSKRGAVDLLRVRGTDVERARGERDRLP